MTGDRPYQYEIHTGPIDLGSVFVPLDTKNWKRPRILSVENLGGVLNIKISEELNERNVTSVEFVNQNEEPELPPNTFKINTRTHIAIDENYMYVWVPSQNRWKRSILSVW